MASPKIKRVFFLSDSELSIFISPTHISISCISYGTDQVGASDSVWLFSVCLTTLTVADVISHYVVKMINGWCTG